MFNKSWFAGLLISLGAMAYLSIGGLGGAFLFAIGLIGVIICESYLFTGKMVLLYNNYVDLLEIWGGNVLGCATGALISHSLAPKALVVIGAKAALGPLNVFILATVCGLLVACATVPHALKWGDSLGRWMLTLGSIAGFIAIGADHCIADMYFWMVSCSHLKWIWVPIVATFGNYLGGLLFKFGVGKKIKS